MRRLPIFLLLDCSESMLGESLKNMEDGIGMLVRSLRQDPHALETVHLSVIAFAGIARTIVPLLEIASFYPPKLPVGSGTALGSALTELMSQIDSQVVKSMPDHKGDWKPIVYLFTDGKPTDSLDKAVSRWKSCYAADTSLIAVGTGPYAQLDVLQDLTEHTFSFTGQGDSDFKKFIQWISDSISVQSKSITVSNTQAVSLAKVDSSIIKLFGDDEKPPVPSDTDCIVIPGRCQKTKKLYLIKYERSRNIIPFNASVELSSHFVLAGCFPMEEQFFEWSTREATNLTVNTNKLSGVPGCPYCGNISAFAMSECGKVMCINGPGAAKCPWCKSEGVFSGSGGEGFNVRRGRG